MAFLSLCVSVPARSSEADPCESRDGNRYDMGISATTLGRSWRSTHLVEESFRVVRPRYTGELDVADLFGKPLVIVRDGRRPVY